MYMLYRFITSGYTDILAYASAFITAIWIFTALQYNALMPGCLVSVSFLYGVVVATFFGALLICKYICLEGNVETIRLLDAEKSLLEEDVKNRDLSVAELNKSTSALHKEIGILRNRIAAMEENSPDKQLSELRMKLRFSEEDKKAAFSVLVKNLQARLNVLTDVHDPQLLFAADVLRREVGLVETELKRGEFSHYELCIKIVDIYEKLTELGDIHLVSSLDQSVKPDSVAETWLHFIRVNDNSDPAAVERSFKFFKVAFHPDRFTSDSLKVEATRYFQHSINAHSSVKRMGNAVP